MKAVNIDKLAGFTINAIKIFFLLLISFSAGSLLVAIIFGLVNANNW